MKHATEDREPTPLSTVAYGLLLGSLAFTAGSVGCHLAASDPGEHAQERSDLESWRLVLGMAAGAAFLGFGGLVGSRAFVGTRSKR